MTDLKAQEKLTDGKGWKQVIVDYGKEKKEQLTTKAKNIAGGVNVVIEKLQPGTVETVTKKLKEIKEIKDKKKRGPRDE